MKVVSWGDRERFLKEVTSESRLKDFETLLMQRTWGQNIPSRRKGKS